MADVQPFSEDSVEDILIRARDEARERLEASFEELTTRVRKHFEAEMEQRARANREQMAGKARRQFANQLNQTLRRIRRFAGDARWTAALLEETAALCDRAALFSVVDVSLRIEASRGIAGAEKITTVPLAEAPAFGVALDTRDTVVALRSRTELSGAIADFVGERPESRCWLFPLTGRERITAIIYADSEEHIDIEALELVTSIAGLVAGSAPAAAASAPEL